MTGPIRRRLLHLGLSTSGGTDALFRGGCNTFWEVVLDGTLPPTIMEKLTMGGFWKTILGNPSVHFHDWIVAKRDRC